MAQFYSIIKPTGMPSTAVVSAVKKYTGQKCGHLGTLDPLAGGVVVVAVGKATKLFDYFLQKDKQYFFVANFGVETDTLDSEGQVICRKDKIIQKTQILQILPKFLGKIEQIPPKYSAISINGQRAYNLARQNKEITLRKRIVQIYDIKLVRQYQNNLFGFLVNCSSGTYIRSLVRDIAAELGTVGTAVAIIRTACGKFDNSVSYTLDDLLSGKAKPVEVDDVISLPHLLVNSVDKQKLVCGNTFSSDKLTDGEYLCYYNKKLVGIASSVGGQVKLKINLWEE